MPWIAIRYRDQCRIPSWNIFSGGWRSSPASGEHRIIFATLWSTAFKTRQHLSHGAEDPVGLWSRQMDMAVPWKSVAEEHPEKERHLGACDRDQVDTGIHWSDRERLILPAPSGGSFADLNPRVPLVVRRRDFRRLGKQLHHNWKVIRSDPSIDRHHHGSSEVRSAKETPSLSA